MSNTSRFLEICTFNGNLNLNVRQCFLHGNYFSGKREGARTGNPLCDSGAEGQQLDFARTVSISRCLRFITFADIITFNVIM